MNNKKKKNQEEHKKAIIITVCVGIAVLILAFVVLFLFYHPYDEGKITKAADCFEGTMTYTCKLCGKQYETKIPGLGHDYPKEGQVVVAPGCETEGKVEYKCSRCNATKPEKVAPLGHDWTDATCEAPKTCLVCGKTDGESAAHIWSENGKIIQRPDNNQKGKMEVTCTVCGKKDTIEYEANELYKNMSGQYKMTDGSDWSTTLTVDNGGNFVCDYIKKNDKECTYNRTAGYFGEPKEIDEHSYSVTIEERTEVKDYKPDNEDKVTWAKECHGLQGNDYIIYKPDTPVSAVKKANREKLISLGVLDEKTDKLTKYLIINANESYGFY